MGLSGRKTKQKIGNDPRNLSWADGSSLHPSPGSIPPVYKALTHWIFFWLTHAKSGNELNFFFFFERADAARFGSNYLSKFGWDPSKGLGVGEEGRTSHIKVAQKLDMMGIGAAHQADPNGVAWKQNKDFENLLKRLNQANGDVEDGDAKEESARIVVDGFVQQKGKLEEEREGEEGEEETVKAGREDDNKERKKKKKKRNEEQTKTKDKGKHKDEDNVEKKKKKRKREGNDTDKKSKKKRKSDNDSASEYNNQDELSPTTPEPIPTTEHKVTRVVPRHRSYVSLFGHLFLSF